MVGVQLLYVDIQFSYHLLKRLSFPHCLLTSLDKLVKNYLTTFAKVYFLDLYSILLVYWLVFMPVPAYFDYCNFVESFKIRSLSPPVLFLFFKIVLAIQDPLRFHVNFRVGFASSMKKSHWHFDSDCMETSECSGWYWHFNNIKFSNYEYGMCLHLFYVFFYFF